MSLLNEYTFTPDIFDTKSYINETECDLSIKSLISIFRNDGIARNLRGELLKNFVKDRKREWHRRGMECLKKIKNNRYRDYHSVLEYQPNNDLDWHKEAVASCREKSLNGIFVSPKLFNKIDINEYTCCINGIISDKWDKKRSNTIRIERTTCSYLDNLDLVLRLSNSMMIIDPYIDPREPRYSSMKEIIKSIENTNKNSDFALEIHRKYQIGSGKKAQRIEIDEWKEIFLKKFGETNLNIKVFIWDDFHDRYIISDLIGIVCSNSFDTTTDSHNMTTWARLDRNTKDDVEREFNPHYKRRRLIGKFQFFNGEVSD